MATTYELIASTTLGSAAASIAMSSIPATFDDLHIVVSARRDSSSGSGAMYLRFNSSTSNYTLRSLFGDGSSAASSTSTDLRFELGNSTDTADTFNSAAIYVPNYAGSSNKSVSIDNCTENNATTAFIWLAAGLWSDTSAISSVSVGPIGSGSLVAGSSVYLYGITKA